MDPSEPSDEYGSDPLLHKAFFFQQSPLLDGNELMGDMQAGQFYDPNGMKRDSPTNWSTMPSMQNDGGKQMKIEENDYVPMATISPVTSMDMFRPESTGYSLQQPSMVSTVVEPQQTSMPQQAPLSQQVPVQQQVPISQQVSVQQQAPISQQTPMVQQAPISQQTSIVHQPEPVKGNTSTTTTQFSQVPAAGSPQPQLLQLPDARQREEATERYMALGLRSARKTLDAVAADLRTFKELLPQIRVQQYDAIHTGNSEKLQVLMGQESEMVGRFKAMNAQIEELDRDHILMPDELRILSELRQESYITCEQLNLYLLEAQQVISAGGGRPSTCIASLVITSQPFPLVISKGKLVDTPLNVVILTGAVQELKQTQHFMPIITTDPPTKSVAQNIVMVVKEDATGSNATQLKLKMMNGSRMMPVMLKMSIAVAYPTASIMLESQCSHPFIVITNENQYEESNGSLLKYLAFGPKSDTPWTKFANELQRHFVQGTKQDGSAGSQLPVTNPVAATAAALTPENLPTRALSVHDLEYIHDRFFAGRPVISVSQFDQFWAWFGKILQRMRSTRQICGMWRDGLLWGFASRNEIEQALMSQPPGSFIVRFSERHAGHFAIAYKNPLIDIRGPQSEPPTPQISQNCPANSCIKHYLVKPEEISTQKTLPDFLNDIAGLSIMIRVLYNDFGTEIDPPLRLADPLFIPISKTEALEKFLSKREQVVLVGYEPNLSPIPMMM